MREGLASRALAEARTLTPELRGYLFWGPVSAAIAVTEVLGVEWVQDQINIDIPWPTISETVGHLIERWSVVAAVVVGAIAAITFSAVAYRDPADRTANGRLLPRDRPPATKFPRYSAWVGIVLPVAAGIVASSVSDNEFVIAYAMYGSFAVYGVIVPSLLVRFASKEVNFPTLFFTFEKLRQRFAWVTATFVALLAVLVFHLGLYPWPSITNEPSEHAGLTAGKARGKAIREVRRLGVGDRLKVSTQTRGVEDGEDAWLVFFSGAGRQFAGCIVTVTEERAEPSPECSA